MSTFEKTPDILTLEPLLEAVRGGIEQAGWVLSGLQKTTSHGFEGRWAGEATRSAYLFFHREDLPDSVSVEAFLDETSRGLRGNLSLVLDGPRLGRLGSVRDVIRRVAAAARETLPDPARSPVSVKLTLAGRSGGAEEAETQIRVKLLLSGAAVKKSAASVSAFATQGISAFEALLECPEVAELLPSVMD
ncbi:MAG: hypothetical protein EXR92_04200 [Gemmatimonadetes bacterium]|nr:hypothetical protein [Gemmatimonadota bacterium]